jgi:environmental stress-induced protein Ves
VVADTVAVQVLRARERVAVPWKNGGGLTREVAVHPRGSGLDDFEWRVSIAQVRAGGPFSAFPGIERQLAVLSGRLELSVAGQPPVTLSSESLPLCFAGELPVSAGPLEGTVTDLNLMTRRDRCIGRLIRGVLGTNEVLQRTAATTTLLLALETLTLQTRADEFELGALDAALISGSTHYELTAITPGESARYFLAEIEPR